MCIRDRSTWGMQGQKFSNDDDKMLYLERTPVKSRDGNGQFGDDINDEEGTKVKLLQRADLKPEVHFFGQIVGGVNFGHDDGLFCEMIVETGPKWEMITPTKTYQTQTCYSEEGEMYYWCHPFDIHYKAAELSGWPKAIFRVWRLDNSGKIDIISYGECSFPRVSGFSKIECETWSPIADWKSNSFSFFLGNNPRLSSADITEKKRHARDNLSSRSSGKIVLEFEVILKNFKRLGLT
eukprot:TRINITY_DN6456_c0_g1_i3.p1 TRINITY_DN6456_c0_g1~~TRINITY_DN6456_c0_g1_i3.p1  ORF type:complete len:237 (+),score=40.03 TRINITY_DN6456_c0_g1_i3:64-774(+)